MGGRTRYSWVLHTGGPGFIDPFSGTVAVRIDVDSDMGVLLRLYWLLNGTIPVLSLDKWCLYIVSRRA